MSKQLLHLYDPIVLAIAAEPERRAPQRSAALPELTERQAAIFLFIADFIARSGFPPTVREIGLAFDIVSPNGVVCHLKALQNKGWLEYGDNAARGIRLLKPVPAPAVHLDPKTRVLTVGSFQWVLSPQQVSHLAGFK